MKKIIMMFLVVCCAAASSFAQDGEKKEIAATELPNEIKAAVGEGDHASWTMVKVFEVTSEGTEEAAPASYYEIHLQQDKESEVVIVNYDTNGKIMD